MPLALQQFAAPPAVSFLAPMAPMQGLYLLLVTNRNSNILEDLDTLRMLSKLIPEYSGPMLDEESVGRAAFDLIFAFDEVISNGHKENITVQQVRASLGCCACGGMHLPGAPPGEGASGLPAQQNHAADLAVMRRAAWRCPTSSVGVLAAWGVMRGTRHGARRASHPPALAAGLKTPNDVPTLTAQHSTAWAGCHVGPAPPAWRPVVPHAGARIAKGEGVGCGARG